MMVGNFLAFDPSYVSPTLPDMMPHPSEYNGQASMLYRQDADGSFTDVTKEMDFYYPQSKCMGLTLIGSKGPASAIGAKVTIQAGEHKQVDRLEIRWPDGHTEIFRDFVANRYLTIIQDKGFQ